MNYTENYELNQWESSDRVLREDFNADNAKIDAAIAARGNCHIVAGSYVGTGTYGADNPNSLTFDFPPCILFIDVQQNYSSGAHLIWFRDGTNYGHPGNLNVSYQLTWEGNTVSWYQTYNSGSTGPAYQLNTSGKTYHYIAIG